MPHFIKDCLIVPSLFFLIGIAGFQNLEASFEMYGRSMAKSGLSQTSPSGNSFI